ncbi:MAG: AAA family ATPase [Myxococcales bacterium]|nr:AAA family ATPase [Myxococcales bacterium]MDD9969851.1 AAA family ATPase [Myxococcales bacterium]
MEPDLALDAPRADDLETARAVMQTIGNRARAAVVGRDDVVELVLIALLSDGHVLLEDYPGSGKTTLARCLGASLAADDTSPLPPFRRIQFTPDLLPSDVTGTSVFELETNRLEFRPGPIFAHIVLADEINRTSPKVQAAMLEAMAEKQVTVDNTTHRLDELFFVIATQNPIDVVGTYPLPTPQLDRFLFKIRMHHIAREAELEVLSQYPQASLSLAEGMDRVSRDQLLRARRATRTGVGITPTIKEALVDLARRLRADDRVLQGASTRSLVLMMPALQARALLRGRDFVAPEDIEALAVPVFGHRIECAPGIQASEEIIESHLSAVVEGLARSSLGS